MREALHIFKKDSRYLRVPIVLVLTWTALFVAATAFESPAFGIPRGPRDAATFIVLRLTTYVLPVGWIYVIARLIHAEAFRGDRRFWLTRPYRRSSLVLAKAIFIVTYLTAPMAIAQMVILLAKGLPLVPYLPALFWSHFLILTMVAIPMAAIAATTSTLGQVIVVSLVLPAAFVLRVSFNDVGPFEWVRSAVAGLVVLGMCVAVLWIQVKTRKFVRSLLVVLGGTLAIVVGLMVPWWNGAFAVQAMTAPGVSNRIRVSIAEPMPPASLPTPAGLVPSRRLGPEQIRLQFALSGMPADTPVMCEGAELRVHGPDGRTWTTPVKQIPTGQPTLITEGCTVFFATPDGYLRQIKGHTVGLRAVLYATVYGPPQTTVVTTDRASVTVPDYGQCKAVTRGTQTTGDVVFREMSVECWSAFRAPGVLSQYVFDARDARMVYSWPSHSPFPAELHLSPVDSMTVNYRRVDSGVIATRHVAGYEKLVVDMPQVDLSSYEVGAR
jgi:hypothetical protein